jgi:hypothetical protein
VLSETKFQGVCWKTFTVSRSSSPRACSDLHGSLGLASSRVGRQLTRGEDKEAPYRERSLSSLLCSLPLHSLSPHRKCRPNPSSNFFPLTSPPTWASPAAADHAGSTASSSSTSSASHASGDASVRRESEFFFPASGRTSPSMASPSVPLRPRRLFL